MRGLALLLTVATGMSGLAYEVAWERYLAVLLGSHGEATAAVLGIFLGGLSVGYALFGRVAGVASRRPGPLPPRLLRVYGLLEIGIGLWALAFPWLFQAARVVSLYGPEGAGPAGFAFDVGLAALLIGPPTVLMGGTIPLLTQALARSLDDATRFHALVYAFNTVGAFAGALLAGFVMISALGLVGTLRAMALVNLLAGLVFLGLARKARGPGVAASATAPAAPRARIAPWIGVALLTGFAMMVVQTTLIRVGGLSFGASPFAFAMVVAVFVLCIALGSFAVSALPRIPDALVLANQALLFVGLYLLYALLPRGPYAAHVLRALFRDIDPAFHAYWLLAFLALLAVVGPLVVLSGATLPLLFHQLRNRFGELGATAGTLYSWNTLGSLLGALLGGYALLFWLDLHEVYRIALFAVAASVALLAVASAGVARLAAAGLLVPVALALVWLPVWSPEQLASGLFRERAPLPESFLGGAELVAARRGDLRIVFHTDDPSTTVTVEEREGPNGLVRSILTNGKSDGATRGDYPTMALAALVPALFAREPQRGFVIGFGTGVTAGELAELEEVREVVVSEISEGVLRAAPLFDFANFGASQHPKIRLVRSDAYRALLRTPERFDVIVSEPSNPWVAGVEMLFSREFLEAARDRLTPGGVYAQWLQQYASDTETLSLVLRTYAQVFDRVAVWNALGADLLLLGFREEVRPLDVGRLLARARRDDFAAGLRRSGVASPVALLGHELVPVGVLHAVPLPGPVQTLLHPRLNHRAGRAFFRGGQATLPFLAFGPAGPVGARNSLVARLEAGLGHPLGEPALAALSEQVCKHRALECATWLAAWQRRAPDSERLATLLRRVETRRASTGGRVPLEAIPDLRLLLGDEPSGELTPGALARITHHFLTHYAHARPFPRDHLLALWDRCRGLREDGTDCREGAALTASFLRGETHTWQPVTGGHPTADGSDVPPGGADRMD